MSEHHDDQFKQSVEPALKESMRLIEEKEQVLAILGKLKDKTITPSAALQQVGATAVETSAILSLEVKENLGDMTAEERAKAARGKLGMSASTQILLGVRQQEVAEKHIESVIQDITKRQKQANAALMNQAQAHAAVVQLGPLAPQVYKQEVHKKVAKAQD